MEKTNKFDLINILKGTLISVLVSLGLILVFAIVLKFVDFSDSIIKIINQIIKIISIFVGIYFVLKDKKEKGFLKGLILGLLYSIIAYFVFSILNTSITFGLSNIIDLIFSGVFGMVSGIFCANIKNREVL